MNRLSYVAFRWGTVAVQIGINTGSGALARECALYTCSHPLRAMLDFSRPVEHRSALFTAAWAVMLVASMPQPRIASCSF